MSNFKIYSRYYDLLYQDKDYTAESSYVAKTLKQYMPKVKSILELGCGSGSHAVCLCNDGFEVTGIERSADMVDIALKKKISGFQIVNSDISSFKLEQKFDSVISLFHVISYLTGNAELIATFKNANHHLIDGGLFLFDVWYSPAVYTQKALPRIKKMSNKELEVTRIANPKVLVSSNVVDVEFNIFIKDLHDMKVMELVENHPMRHFTIPEISLLAEFTGFEVLRVEEFLTCNEATEDTWGVSFILTKKK